MKNPIEHFGFDPKNYKWLFIGLAINVLGYILMIGGGAETLNEFKEEELFSPIRITLAPILIVGGYVVILFSIMKKPALEFIINQSPLFQNELNDLAMIIRKYNLGDRDFFINNLSGIDFKYLHTAWDFGSKKIQNKEIVKIAENLTPEEKIEVDKLMSSFNEFSKEEILKVLNKNFDVKKYKLSDEKVHRVVLNFLANKYMELTIKNLSSASQNRIQTKIN